MKKLLFVMVAFVAMGFASCGQTAPACSDCDSVADTTVVDTCVCDSCVCDTCCCE